MFRVSIWRPGARGVETHGCFPTHSCKNTDFLLQLASAVLGRTHTEALLNQESSVCWVKRFWCVEGKLPMSLGRETRSHPYKSLLYRKKLLIVRLLHYLPALQKLEQNPDLSRVSSLISEYCWVSGFEDWDKVDSVDREWSEGSGHLTRPKWCPSMKETNSKSHNFHGANKSIKSGFLPLSQWPFSLKWSY